MRVRASRTLACALAGIVGGLMAYSSPALAIDDSDITQYSVWGDTKVDLERSTVNSGLTGSAGNVVGGGNTFGSVDGVRAGGDVIFTRSFNTMGDVIANGKVEMKQYCVFDPTDSDVIAGGSVAFLEAGCITPPATVSDFAGTPFATLPELPSVSPCAAGGDDYTVAEGDTLTLAPGSYGVVYLLNHAKLSLEAGDYAFKILRGRDAIDINIDLGPAAGDGGEDIFVCVEQYVDFYNHLNVNLTDGVPEDVLWQVDGNWRQRASGTVNGTIFAVDGDIKSDNGVTYNGALYAGATAGSGVVDLRNGSQVNFHLADQFIALIPSDIPPPATFSVFAAGGDLDLKRSDVLGGLVGTSNGWDVLGNTTATALDGVRSSGDVIAQRGIGTNVGNDIIAKGDINITDPCNTITNGDYIAEGTVVNGDCNTGSDISGSAVFYTPPALPASICEFPLVPGPDKTVSDPGLDLAPGTYGDVGWGVSQVGPLRLLSGTYVFNSMNLGNDGQVEIDLTDAPGQIIICVKVGLGYNRGDFILTGPGSAADVYVEAHGSGTAISGSVAPTVIGTQYAPNGGISLNGNNTSITGAVYAGGPVIFGNSTTVNFVPHQVAGAPAFP